MMRLIPPIAVPASPGDVATSVARARAGGARALAERLALRCGFVRAELFGSGREALAVYLRASLPRDSEVLVPAYTCYSVAAAVVRAGLRVRLVDVDPATLAVTPETIAQAAGRLTSCAIVAHLFARTGEVDAIAAAARARTPDLHVVEDAAQALPVARARGADAVLLSFGRGKPLALGGGGAVLHDGQALAPVRKATGGWARAASLVATSMLSHPVWFRIPELIPALGIGETVYDPAFAVDVPFFEWQLTLGLQALDRFAAEARRRSEHARRLLEKIDDSAGWSIPAPARGEGPIRLPLLAPGRVERERALLELRRRGVRASRMYPGTLADIPQLRPHLANAEAEIPGARLLADRLITLPIYPTLSAADLERVAAALRAVTTRGRA